MDTWVRLIDAAGTVAALEADRKRLERVEQAVQQVIYDMDSEPIRSDMRVFGTPEEQVDGMIVDWRDDLEKALENQPDER